MIYDHLLYIFKKIDKTSISAVYRSVNAYYERIIAKNKNELFKA